MGELLTFGAKSAFAALLLAAAIIDGRSYRLPNWLTLAVAAAFLPWAIFELKGPTPWLIHGSAALIVFLVTALAFARGIMGGGDAKLLAACALWTGWAELGRFMLVTSLAGGILALIVLMTRPAGSARRLPYGIAIAAGGFDFWLRLAPGL